MRARGPLAPMSSLSVARLHELVDPVCDASRSQGWCIGRSRKVYNWGGSFVCQPDAIFRPTTVEEVCAIVELARRVGGVEVRAMGRCHSPGDVVFTRGWLLQMHALDGLLSIDAHAETPSITVLGGTYVSDMHTMLEMAEVPLAMKSVGSISEQTIAGLVSTATHGTGIHHPVISACVLSMRIVCALPDDKGGTQVVSCSRAENAELFNASLCGLGTTGLIVEVTLAVDHWFKLKQIAEECTFDSLFGPPTGAPAVFARVASRSHYTVGKDHDKARHIAPQMAGRQNAHAGNEAVVSKQKQPVGYFLAHNRSGMPSETRRYPSTSRILDPSTIYPIQQSDQRFASKHAEDDETTVQAQQTLEALAESAQHVRMAWAPQAGMVTLMRMNRTLEPVQTPGILSRIYGRVVGFHLLQLMFFLARYNAALPSRVNCAAYYLTHPSKRRSQLLGSAANPEGKQPEDVKEGTKAFSDTIDDFRKGSFEPRTLISLPRPTDDPRPIHPDNPTSTLVDASHRVFNVECLFRQYTNEWALPLSQAGAALRAMRDWLDEEERLAGGVRIHFPVEMRFSDADGIWLSPCQDRKTCYIGIVLYRCVEKGEKIAGTSRESRSPTLLIILTNNLTRPKLLHRPYNLPNRYRELFTKYETLMRHFGGRPHWAKAHTCGALELRSMYPHMDDFLRVRQEFDAEGVFLNPYTRRHLLGHVSADVSPRMFKSHL